MSVAQSGMDCCTKGELKLRYEDTQTRVMLGTGRHQVVDLVIIFSVLVLQFLGEAQ